MHPLVARLRDSERAWTLALFCGFWLVLASGSPLGSPLPELVARSCAAALGTLLALWVARASGLRRHGLAIALAALFTTPLLPYSFVERELLLPLLLFVAGFLAIGPTRLRSPLRETALLLASAGVLLTDASGLLLLPLLVWLAWCSAERGGAERPADPNPRFYVAAAILLLLFVAQVWTLDFQSIAFADSPIDWLVHVHGFLLSLNKGLWLFAPLALFGLWRAFRGAVTDRRTGHFALLAAASLIVPFAGLEGWADASWGPRPLLAAMAPALLALALSRSERARRGGRRRWIVAAVACGLATNTLGTALPQSALAQRAGLPSESAAVALQFDPAWNHPRVNAALLGQWLGATFAGEAQQEARAATLVRPSPILLRVLDFRETALRPIALLLALVGFLGWALLVLVRHAAKS